MTIGWSAREAELAAAAIGTLIERGETVATAESLTGGLVVGLLTSVPGASAVVRGGIVAYTAELKESLLGVPADLLARHGTVHAEVAEAMAHGARHRLGASVGVGTTGVAGPDPVDGHPVGTVHIAVSWPGGQLAEKLTLGGDRHQIRIETVRHVLNLLVRALREESDRLQRYGRY